MTKTKKVVAMLLAFLMIFSSASVLASAWDVDADDGKTLEISTKIFKEVNGEWVETEKVAPGSNVKARVYIGTDYYSNDSDLLFFYNKDFFTHSYGTDLNEATVNPDAAVKADAYFVTDADLNGYVDSAFLDDYASFAVNLDVNTTYNVKFDDSTWLFEFDLVVLDSASGEGDFFVEEATVQNTTDKSEQYITVPKGPADGTLADVYPMWLWDATPVLSSQPVSTLSSVTFNANDGAFTDGETEKVIGTDIGDEVAAPAAPERAGYTFMGWIDAADATPTLEEAKATVVVAEVPEEPIAYNAFWLKNVNITFNTDGGSEIAPIEDVTPYTDFTEIAAPSKEGYTFVGWDVRGGELPATYPDADTTYTAIWALNVTMTFDTDGGTAIPSVGGFEGDTFGDDDYEVIPNPSKEGHRFVMWSPALPEVYPEADTTYTAIYETKTYSVSYFVDGKAKLEISLEYGEPVPTKVASVKVPAGYELSGWYTDEACTVEYAGGTMGAETIKLYAKTTPIEYNAIFVVDGETYATVPTAFEDKIAAPADPSKAGYEFAGWSPDADGIFTETEDMYFYATWNPVNGNVIFVADGENYQVDTGIETGATIDLPADPYKEGYTFLGWADSADATEANVTFPQTMPELAEGEKVMYYAVFAINSYEMTWDVDGETTVETYEYNATIAVPADPEKEGYTFAGWEWTRTEGGADVPSATKMPAYDVTATATWNVNQYTVKWIVDDVVIEETKYNYGATITKPADPEKAGYVFNGWTPVFVSTMGAADVTYTATWANATDTPYTIETYTMNADGSYGAPVSETKYGVTGESVTAAYVENDGFRLDAANSELTKAIAADGSTVLKVYLARNSYKVTTDVDGVTAEVADVLFGAEIAEPAAPANKEGHTFAGWAEYTDGMTMPVGGQKFTATWTVNNYTVKWDVDGAITEETYAYGAEVKAPADPTKEGYTFAGWSPSVPATQGAADATYTATWTTNKYLVEFIVDGVTVQSSEVEFGATVTKPADPEKAGYTFTGWDPAVPATQGAAAATYTATWAPAGNTYKVETYLMDTTGGYGEPTVEIKEAATETPVSAAHADITGFTPATEGNVLEGVVAADGSTTLKLYYTRNQYAFSTNVDGTVTKIADYYYEATVATPADPEKAGYDFAGWDPSVPATMPADDVTVTATWTEATDTAFKVIINYNDGANNDAPATIVKDYTGTTNGKVVISDTPVADAQNITWEELVEGWNDAQYYEATVESAEATIAADGTTVINVNFVPVLYTATFNALEGAFAYGAKTATVTVDHFDLVKDNLPAEPTREGWSFGGWNGVTNTLTLSGDRTFPAIWTKNNYTVTWDVDGVTTEETYAYGATINKMAAPSKEGHTFAGWESYTDGMTMPAENKTFTATWTVNNYTVKWDVDGAITEETYAYGAAINKPADPEKVGYTFAGWTPAVPATQGAADATYTAQWTVNNYTVKWNVDGVITEETIAYGADVKAPADPEKEGYTFAGWSPAVPATQGAADATYEATWTVNEYNVEFIVDGVTVQSGKVAYGADVKAPADPTKEGYTFNGWSPEVPATQGAADATYTAQWTVNSYNAIFNAEDGSLVASVPTEFGKAPVAPAAPVKVGYGFAGWLAEDGKVYASSALPVMGAADATYTATYTAGAVNYTVETYLMDTEGNYGAATSSETKSGTADTLATATHVAKEGFSADLANSELEKNIEADGSTVLKLYYSRNKYALSTNVDGTVEKVNDYYYEAVVAEPAAPANKEGHTFAGWEGYTAGMKMTAGAVELKATWTVNNYTVTWVVDEKSTEETYAYGATINKPADPTKEGHTFAGWSPAVPATQGAADATYTAQWTVNNYTVKWNVDGVITEETYAYGADVKAPADPEKEGYTFAGWSPAVPATQGAADATYEATWTVNEYNVEFIVDGVAVQSGKVAYGADVKAPADPAKEGYTFAGWTPEVPATQGAADATYTAQWTVNKYTATFVVDGVTVQSGEVEFGATISKPADPEKTGYTFKGWAPAVPETMPASDKNFTATWSKNSYKVEFIVDDVVVKTGSVEYGAEVEKPADPEKTGYTFAGWTPAVPETQGAADATYTAQWTVNNYTVKWDVDGVITEETYAYGAAINKMAAPSKEGHTFAGWEGYTDGMTMPAENKTFKATWTVNNYTVKWDVDGVITEETYAYGAAVKAPADPAKEGYTFAGWTPEVPATQGAADATYTASWTVNNYTVTWIVDGEVIKTETIAYGAAVTAPVPEKDGYTFSGWTPAVPATQGAADATYEGSFIAEDDIVYTIETYIMDTEGAYGTPSTVTKTGETDSEIVLTPEEKTGFTLDTEGSVLKGVVAADGSLVLKVYYTRNQYNVITNVDGDENVVETVYFEATVAEPAAPADKEGHTFAGWEGYTAGMKMPAEDVTLTAKWTVNNYTVTWDVDGVTTEETYAYGAAINKMAAPEKEGYTFAGWEGYTDGMTMPAENKTFKATWTVNEYNVEFIVDGVAVQSGKVAYGDAVKAPADPAKEGYTFAGWTPAVSATQGAADATYTAQWTVNQYTVTYANTGDTTIAAVTADYGTAIAPVADPTWEGYSFTGWKWTNAEGAEIFAPATVPAYNVTATAQWKANSYTIEWIVDGTTVAANAHDFGADVTVPAAPEKAGYTFAGWTWAKEDGSAVASSTTMPAYNVVATAQWTAAGDTAYTVEVYKMNVDGVTYDKQVITGLTGATESTATYIIGAETGFTVNADKTTGFDAAANTANAVIKADGSTVIAVYYDRIKVEITINGVTDEYVYGEEITEPAKPEAPEGYEQDGWVDEDGNVVTFPITVDEDNPSEIKPNYKKLSYTIAWTIDGVTTTDTYEYEAAVTAPEIPAKNGYRVVGWMDASGKLATIPATMPASDLAYTAIYETLVYGVNYYVDGKLVSTVSAEYGEAIQSIKYNAPFGYEFDGWYTDEEMTAKLADGATVEAKETKLYGKLVAKKFNATFIVDDEEYAVVETAFDAQIIAPADPVKAGYNFIGWTPDVGIMDAEGLTFTANFEPAENAFSVTYIVDGEEFVYPLTEGAEFEIPADPFKEGYTFAGWADAEGNIVDEFPATMPAENLTYTATWTVISYTVTWIIDGVETEETYEFGATIVAPEATKEGWSFVGWEPSVPATMPAEDLTFTAIFAQDTVTVTFYDYPETAEPYFDTEIADRTEVYATQVYDAGATIVLPEAPTFKHYTFAGWIDAEGNAYAEGDVADSNKAYYASYERVAVTLIAVEGSTTVIERHATDSKQNYIYGFTNKRALPTTANLVKDENTPNGRYITYTGDGSIEIIRREGMESQRYLGTGTKIILRDNVTGEVAEEFYLIYFGDVNGDCSVNNADFIMVDNEIVIGRTWSAARGSQRVPYMIKAANLDGNTSINAADRALIDGAISAAVTIDQSTGSAK